MQIFKKGVNLPILRETIFIYILFYYYATVALFLAYMTTTNDAPYKKG